VVTVSGSGVVLPPSNNTLVVECTAGQFFVPDMRGRAPVGAGAGFGLSNRAIGQQIGAETHTLSVTELPAHTHGGIPGPSANFSGGANTAHTGTSASTASTGGGLAHNNMQPSLVMNYIIKT